MLEVQIVWLFMKTDILRIEQDEKIAPLTWISNASKINPVYLLLGGADGNDSVWRILAKSNPVLEPGMWKRQLEAVLFLWKRKHSPAPAYVICLAEQLGEKVSSISRCECGLNGEVALGLNERAISVFCWWKRLTK